MMASGEIRLSATTMRRMPVLAQSQGSISMAPSADGFAAIVVTGSRSNGGPLLAQVIDPVPVLGIDEYLESPAMQALRQGRLPTPAEQAASQPKYVPRIGVPPPL